MNFLELYGDQLDRALGSSDRANLFTISRRKDAVNEAQLWFVNQTECLSKTGTITLVDNTAKYDLVVALNDPLFLRQSMQSPEVWATDGITSVITYTAGREFPRRTIDWLNESDPGWRSATKSINPTAWYLDPDGSQQFGIYPPPDVTAPNTAVLKVPYVLQPAAMVNDADVPFTVGTATNSQLIPYHPALPAYAASLLEKMRKGEERAALDLQEAQLHVADYADKFRVPGGRVIQVMRPYRTDARLGYRGTDGERFGRVPFWGTT